MEFQVLVVWGKQWLAKLLALEEVLPPEWRYPDAATYYEEVLNDPECIHVVCVVNNNVIGYVLARPQEDLASELHEHDPEFVADTERYYVENAVVSPVFMGSHMFRKALKRVFAEGKRRGRIHFSAHTRVSNGLSRMIQLLLGSQVTLVRRIDNWYYYGGAEPTDYIEVTLEK
jgi:hypothetical protein